MRAAILERYRLAAFFAEQDKRPLEQGTGERCAAHPSEKAATYQGVSKMAGHRGSRELEGLFSAKHSTES